MANPHVSQERHHHCDPCTGQHKVRHHTCSIHLQNKKGLSTKLRKTIRLKESTDAAEAVPRKVPTGLDPSDRLTHPATPPFSGLLPTTARPTQSSEPILVPR